MSESNIQEFIKELEANPEMVKQLKRVLEGYPAVQGNYVFQSSGTFKIPGQNMSKTVDLEAYPDVLKVYPGDKVTIDGVGYKVISTYRYPSPNNFIVSLTLEK